MKFNYQNFVIKNGKFIGKFEEMYQKFPDPWDLIKHNKHGGNLNYKNIYNLCDKLKQKKNLSTLEIGCGFPQISNQLNKNGFEAYGTDISKTVIRKSKKKYPNLKKNLFVSNFLNFSLYEKLNPDIIILSNITWYILPQLEQFIEWYKNLKKEVYLIHSLSVCGKDEQKYGKEFFYDLKSIKSFFKIKYLSSGYIENKAEDQHAYFLGTNK